MATSVRVLLLTLMLGVTPLAAGASVPAPAPIPVSATPLASAESRGTRPLVVPPDMANPGSEDAPPGPPLWVVLPVSLMMFLGAGALMAALVRRRGTGVLDDRGTRSPELTSPYQPREEGPR